MVEFEKYILSAGTHWISNSGSDERGSSHGGTAGDQTGGEWRLRGWYSRPWSCVLRYPDICVGLKLAQLGCAAAKNDRIGYDQWQRTTYWARLKEAGYDPAAITEPCEADCTAGVTANVKAAGALLGVRALEVIPIDTYSANMRARFEAAGFRALKEAKYLSGPEWLLPGDVLLYEGHHAATNVTKGSRAEMPAGAVASGLRRGDEGGAVLALQKRLMAWKAACLPKYGADGEFGAETEAALRDYQRTMGIPETGVYDQATHDRMDAAPGTVVITGETVNIRSAPSTITGTVIGYARKGRELRYQGVDSAEGWHLVEYLGMNAWVSPKMSKMKS